MGNTGIPIGLPLAPELARMATAYLLSDYETPIGHSLTIYFDDVSATYPINNLPLTPYNLKDTPPNQIQDAKYDPITKLFTHKPLGNAYLCTRIHTTLTKTMRKNLPWFRISSNANRIGPLRNS